MVNPSGPPLLRLGSFACYDTGKVDIKRKEIFCLTCRNTCCLSTKKSCQVMKRGTFGGRGHGKDSRNQAEQLTLPDFVSGFELLKFQSVLVRYSVSELYSDQG